MVLEVKFNQHFLYFVVACALATPAQAQYVQQGSKYLANGTYRSLQGYAVAVSGDGNTVVYGAPASGTGGAWVMTRSGTTWTTQSWLSGSGGVGTLQQEGDSVGLSLDGNTAIVGDIGDNNFAGAAWVFTRSGTMWNQQGGKLVGTGAVNGTSGAQQGSWVALSGDGNTAIVGAQGDNNGAGAAWIFTRSGSTWAQQGTKLVGTGARGNAAQGRSVALSADGNTAIVGGVFDNSLTGAAWIFARSGSAWAQQGAKLVGTGAVGYPGQGVSVGLSADGNTAIVGGQGDNNDLGAAWVFTRSGSAWTQQGPKLVGTGWAGQPQQGSSVALSGDGSIAMVSGQQDGPNLTGATWLFTRSGTNWTQFGAKLVGSGSNGSSYQGWSGALSADGSTVVVGGPEDAAEIGAVWVFVAPPPVITSVVDAAAQGARLAPGSAASALGTSLPTFASAGALVGGQAAQVLLAGATQWNIVIPTTASTGATTVQIGTSAPFNIVLTQYAPALFTNTQAGTGIVMAVRANSTTGSASAISASNPALPGDVVTVYGTGFGSATASAMAVLLAGVSVNPSSVAPLAGSPGTYQVTFTVPGTMAAGNQKISVTLGGQSSNSLTLPVGLPPLPVITSPLTAQATVGTPFSYQIVASNAPTIFAATGLPQSLTLNTNTGLVSGTPAAPGVFVITLSAANSAGTATASLTLTVKLPAPTVTTPVNAASSRTGLAPGSLATIFGSYFTTVATVFDNGISLPPSNNGSPCGASGAHFYGSMGFNFTVPTASDFVFAGGAVAMSASSGGNDVTLGLYADSANAPGALLDSIKLPGIGRSPAIVQFSSAAYPALSAGRQYWLIASVPAGSSSALMWAAPASGDPGQQAVTTDGGPWTIQAWSRSTFQILGNPKAGSTPLPASLGGVSVLLGERPVPMLFVSPGQINFQVPYELLPGNYSLVATGNSGSSTSTQVTVQAAAPGIFVHANNWAVVQNQDYSINDASNPAKVGSYVTLYGTGAGAVSPPVATGAAAPGSPLSYASPDLTATINGIPATVSFAGLTPGNVGLLQVNLQVPPLPGGTYPIQITIGGVRSNTPSIAVAQ